jgi:hypothetical protein
MVPIQYTDASWQRVFARSMRLIFPNPQLRSLEDSIDIFEIRVFGIGALARNS